MSNTEWVPTGIDVTKPSIARTYDYLLGGKDNFPVDREMAERILALTPEGREAGHLNRAFLRRTVRYLAASGVRQFLDIGSGLPTQQNVHEIAQMVAPDARTVYIDNDPIVLAHGRALLADDLITTVIKADLRRPKEILDSLEISRFIDFDQPIGLLFFGILHHIADEEDPQGVVATLRESLCPNSYIAVSHFFDPEDEQPEFSEQAAASERIFNETLGTGRWRTRAEILAYFGEMELVEPGLVRLPDWRPDRDSPGTPHTFVNDMVLGGVGRKR